MGYLQLSSGFLSDVTKAVFSFWFRVPSASISAAAGNIDPTALLRGCVPLMVFGTTNQDSTGNDLGPSFIGVDAFHDTVPALGAAINFASFGSFSGSLFDNVDVCNPAYPSAHNTVDSFQIIPGGDGYRVPTPADLWHHLLLSFDVSGGMSTTNDPRATWGLSGANWLLWAAMDDVNYSGTALNDASILSGNGGIAGGSNQIYSNGAGVVPVLENSPQTTTHAGDTGPPDFTPICNIPGTAVYRPGSYNFSDAVSASGFPIGIPATSVYSSFIQKVEMAELQVFTGVSVDTSVQANRRAFINSDGTPAAPSAAQTLLGKAPDVLMSSFKKWKAGTNSGTLGPFTSTGTINAFAKNPRLGT